MTKAEAVVAGPRYARAAVTSDLLEQITLFRAYTATRELPALPS
jgi:hypothetical protein